MKTPSQRESDHDQTTNDLFWIGFRPLSTSYMRILNCPFTRGGKMLEFAGRVLWLNGSVALWKMYHIDVLDRVAYFFCSSTK